PADRAWVYERDSHACLKCGSDESLTVDHLLPRALGGADHRSHDQTLCASYNAVKWATCAVYRVGSNGQMALALKPPRPAEMSLRERFMAKVSVDGDCWMWTAALFNGITPAINVEGKSVSAAQVAWTEFVGDLPDSKLYRTCGKTLCVRPEHLTTRSEERT